MSKTKDLIRSVDEEDLVAIVMMLTGGWANPSVVRHQIARIRAEAADDGSVVIGTIAAGTTVTREMISAMVSENLAGEPPRTWMEPIPVFASDVVMDEVDRLEKLPANARSEDDQRAIDYARGNYFTRHPKIDV